ncbi:hypothetical protein [Aliikangiella sp. IMCC44359]|uniref:hypothetical protein n=1 Tax=Aliikangiella sp. IMCC44359 TaxID=3459125 RepID=UPI00403B1A78
MENQKLLSFIMFFALVGIVLAGYIFPIKSSWIAIMALIVIFILCLGKKINNCYFGVLINDQNIISLSRFQMTLWTIIIISFFAALVMARVKSEMVFNPMNIQIPWEIWTLLGIQVSAMVGSPLIASNKGNKDAQNSQKTKDATQVVAKSLNKSVDDVLKQSKGLLYCNPKSEEADFSDMFKGEEVGNRHSIELARLQMFLFTVVVAAVYIASMTNMMIHGDILMESISFQPIDQGLLTLMGISNGGYLVNKNITHTPN